MATQPVTTIGAVSTASKPVGDIFTLRAAFKNGDIIVPVSNPYVRIKPVDGKECISFGAVGSMPTDTSHTRWAMTDLGNNYYTITIDPSGMAYGWYDVYYCGDYNDGTGVRRIGISGTIEIQPLDKASYICNRVMSRIADDDMESYLITAPRFHHFKANSMMALMPMAINYFNVTGPTKLEYTIENFSEGESIFIIEHMIAQAMFQKARIAVDNDMYLTDNKSLQQNKFDKYLQLYNIKMAEIKASIVEYKKATPAFGYFQRRAKYPIWVVYAGLSTGTSSLFMGPFQSTTAGYF